MVSALWGLEERHVIQNKAIRVRTPIRVKAVTEKSEFINNMLSWQPLSFIAEDGALVKQGDILASYQGEELDHQMQSLLLNRSLIGPDGVELKTSACVCPEALHDADYYLNITGRHNGRLKFYLLQ